MSYYGPTSGPAPQDHPQGTTILVLGILSLVCCGLFTGIPAIVMGRQADRLIAANPGVYSNATLVKAGFICGIIGTALSVLAVLFYGLLFFTALSTGR